MDDAVVRHFDWNWGSTDRYGVLSETGVRICSRLRDNSIQGRAYVAGSWISVDLRI